MASGIGRTAADKETARSGAQVPGSLREPGARRFWLAVVLTGAAAGLGAAALTALLKEAQGLAWGANEPSALTEAARRAGALRHVGLLLSAGLLTGAGQWLLTRLASSCGLSVVSIHAPAGGRLTSVVRHEDASVFRSTPPRGATTRTRLFVSTLGFRSTPPRGGRLVPARSRMRRNSFDPRPRGGGDPGTRRRP